MLLAVSGQTEKHEVNNANIKVAIMMDIKIRENLSIPTNRLKHN